MPVPLLAGTDAGNPIVIPGFSLHIELELLARAGLSPLAALQAATLSLPRDLGATDSLGTGDFGKLADLVLLDADPLADICSAAEIGGNHTGATWTGRSRPAARRGRTGGDLRPGYDSAPRTRGGGLWSGVQLRGAVGPFVRPRAGRITGAGVDVRPLPGGASPEGEMPVGRDPAFGPPLR